MTPARYPGTLRQLADHITTELVAQGYERKLAAEAAYAATEFLRRTYGGTDFYVSRGRDARADERARAIWEGFNGRNHDQLAAEHGVSKRWVEIVVAYMRERTRVERQADLPGIDHPEREAPPPIRGRRAVRPGARESAKS